MRHHGSVRSAGVAAAAVVGSALLLAGAVADTTAPYPRTDRSVDTVALDTSLDEPAEPEPVDWGEVDPRVRAAAQEKLDDWLARRKNECLSLALKKAAFRADSMILAYARDLNLRAERPGRPLRPPEPPLLRPSDTLQLRPFFD